MFRVTRPTVDYRNAISRAWFASFEAYHDDVYKLRRVNALNRMAKRELVPSPSTWQSQPTIIDAWAE